MTGICGGASSWQSEAAACPGELLGGQILPQAGLPVWCSLRGSRRRGQSSPAAAVAAATRGPITAARISRRRRVKVGILCILRAARLLNRRAGRRTQGQHPQEKQLQVAACAAQSSHGCHDCKALWRLPGKSKVAQPSKN